MTFINCATLSPDAHQEVEQAAKAVGAMCLEAAMASSIPQAQNGEELCLMVGGDKKCSRPSMSCWKPSPRISPLHEQEMGDAAKGRARALVNMVMNTNTLTAALAEGLGLGDALGLDIAMLRKYLLRREPTQEC